MNPLAVELAAFPELVDRLRRDHIAGDRGECVVCSGQRGAVHHPCTLATVAADAAELIERRNR